ncbi:MAG: hypothetical protein FJ026_17855, partial [Chloroflexi bacterium]|nr:hypothetical protein [Chloroflexota bacterium]
MAQYYGPAAVFVEYAVDNPPDTRYYRWWAPTGGGGYTLPLAMVDSGNQRNEGSVDCYHVYKRMVDASLARPAQAEIQAYCWRTGNPAVCYAQVTNLSPLTLSGSANSAAVHAIAYEDARVGVTDRFGRRAGMYEMP